MPSPAITARSMVRVMRATLPARPPLGTAVSRGDRLDGLGRVPVGLGVEQPEPLAHDGRVLVGVEAHLGELGGEERLVDAAPVGEGEVALPLGGGMLLADLPERDDLDLGGDDERAGPPGAVEDDREVAGRGDRLPAQGVGLVRARGPGLATGQDELEEGVGLLRVRAERPRRWLHRPQRLLADDDVEPVEAGPLARGGPVGGDGRVPCLVVVEVVPCVVAHGSSLPATAHRVRTLVARPADQGAPMSTPPPPGPSDGRPPYEQPYGQQPYSEQPPGQQPYGGQPYGQQSYG